MNLFKLVCLRANPNNSRRLLNSKLMRIRCWKRKKQQLNIDNCFLHTSTRLFLVLFFILMKWFCLTQEKVLQKQHLHVSRSIMLQFRMFQKVKYAWIVQMCSDWKRIYKTAQETTQLPKSARSNSRVVTMLSSQTALQKQVNADRKKNAVFLEYLSKSELWVNFGLSLHLSIFRTKRRMKRVFYPHCVVWTCLSWFAFMQNQTIHACC